MRTGSTWLCDLLRDRGVGDPDEYLEPRLRTALIDEWGIEQDGYFPELWARRSPGGVFGTKVFWAARFYPWVDGDLTRVFSCPLDEVRWVLLTRDSHEQAVSWITARRTGRIFGPPPRPKVRYTEHEVACYEELVREHTLSWQYWFRDLN